MPAVKNTVEHFIVGARFREQIFPYGADVQGTISIGIGMPEVIEIQKIAGS